MKRPSARASVAAAALLLSSCTTHPPGPDVSDAAIAREAERLARLEPAAPAVRDLDRDDLVRAMRKLRAAAEPYCVEAPELCRFSLWLVHDDDANAWIDGRHRITFTRPLLDLCDSIDEAAFVLAHEMAHGLDDHVADTRARGQFGSLILQGSLIALGALAGFTPSSGDLREVGSFGADLGHRVYSKPQELAADRLAFELTEAAGFDPAAGIRVFERLALDDPARGSKAAWLAHHPSFAERIARLKAIAASTPEGDGALGDLASAGGSG